MPPSTGMTTAQFVAYIIFMVLSLPVMYIRPHKLQVFFYISAATVMGFEIVILIWSLATMGDSGFGSTIAELGGSGSGWHIAFGIVSTIGGAAAGILNQNDYSRFATKPPGAILGQLIGCPVYSTLCAVVGILVTAATQNRYGAALWRLPTLLGAIMQQGGSRSRVAAFFGGAALSVSQMGLNVPGNALAGGTAVSAAVYAALHYIFRDSDVRGFVDSAPSPELLMREYRARWDHGEDPVGEIVEQVKP
ncbi:hypothetical protein BBP40_001863 [Aspergillus hancockii]|nr:hypothetical protein BBP40_001863 [Aspergillus hancockii]